MQFEQCDVILAMAVIMSCDGVYSCAAFRWLVIMPSSEMSIYIDTYAFVESVEIQLIQLMNAGEFL